MALKYSLFNSMRTTTCSITLHVPKIRLLTTNTFRQTVATISTASTPHVASEVVNSQQPNISTTSPALKQHLTIADRIALRFRDYLPNTTDTYVAYEVTRELYLECAFQAGYVDGQGFTPSAKFWYETCRRPPTFSSWAQVTVLHMWMLAARMRALDRGRVGIWQQHFIDHFFYDSEDKMVKRYGIKRAGARSGYMKDLYHQYRGMTAAFDEGFAKGDSILATAIWRNIFDAAEDVDLEILAIVTSHVRRVLSKLGQVDDDAILKGRVKFGLPFDEAPVVGRTSRLLEELKNAPEATEPMLAPEN